ncbi:MAG: L-lactate permease [Armatimonadota bacterium]
MPGTLPVTLFLWVMALLPLLLILLLLVWRRWSAAEAGPVGFFTVVAVALLFFRTPITTVANAAGRGIWDAIFILYVIWAALLLYQVTKQAGAFDSMRRGIQRHTENQLFLVLAFGWVFASFLQGIAGFGAPIAIVAPLLVGLGVRPIMAVVIPLIGHAWANLFGTLAVAWHATRLVVDLQNEPLTALYAGWLLWIPNVLAGFAICWLYGKWQAVKIGLWAVLIISVLHGGGQLFLTQINPTLSNFIPTTLALGLLFGLTRWGRYSERAMEESPVMEESGRREQEQEEPKMPLHEAFAPYYALIAVSVTALVVPAFRTFLEQVEVGVPFPAAATGYGITTEAESPYSPFPPFTHPGTFLLLAAILGYLWFHWRGHYGEGFTLGKIWAGTLKNAIPASVAVLAFLAMSKLMDIGGLTTVLALGIAAVSPAAVYVGLASLIGIIGAFMTSSNTASNILFVPLHQETAQAITALSEPVVIASQSAGAAVGNSIAPANVVLGTGTAGIPGKEGAVLRYTLVFAAIAGVLIGGTAILFHFFR